MCALIVVPFVVNIIVPRSELLKSLPFVYMSTLSILVPFVGLSFVNYEFPTLAAGIFGLCITTVLTLCRIGLGPHEPKGSTSEASEASGQEDSKVGPKDGEKDGENGKVTEKNADADLENGKGTIDVDIDAADGITFSGPSGDVPTKIASKKQAAQDDKDAPGKAKSNKSLKGTTVNPQVEVCHKTLKKFHKGRHMAIMPMALWKAHHRNEQEDFDQARTHKHDIHDDHHHHFLDINWFDAVFRTMPLWLTVVLLILTRIEPIGLKSALRMKEPTLVDGDLGTLGHLSISAVGRFSLTEILGTSIVSRQQGSAGCNANR